MGEYNGLRDSYDRIASHYTDAFFDELSRKPFDRALLDRYAERIRQQEPPAPVWDVGCGPGHVARYLSERGLSLTGLDLSEQMVLCARRLSPAIPFVQGAMLALPLADDALAGIVSFYAIIHLTRADAARALREFRRVLRPGGSLLLAFHGGEGEVHNEEWFGEPVAVTATLFAKEEMARYAKEAGFTIVEALDRAPYDFEYQSRRIYLLAEKPD